MKVICFKGKGDTWKTTLIKRILNEFFNIEIYMNKEHDFAISFLYKNTLIGICSYGDELPYVKTKIEKIISKGCKIIICACRTQGGLLKYITELDKNINWIKPNGSTGKFEDSEFQQFIEIFNNLMQD